MCGIKVIKLNGQKPKNTGLNASIKVQYTFKLALKCNKIVSAATESSNQVHNQCVNYVCLCVSMDVFHNAIKSHLIPAFISMSSTIGRTGWGTVEDEEPKRSGTEWGGMARELWSKQTAAKMASMRKLKLEPAWRQQLVKHGTQIFDWAPPCVGVCVWVHVLRGIVFIQQSVWLLQAYLHTFICMQVCGCLSFILRLPMFVEGWINEWLVWQCVDVAWCRHSGIVARYRC